MTEGNITKHLLKFAVPIMGGLFLQMLYNTVDGIVVGNFVGETALGAVNTSGSFGNLLIAIASGLAAGSSVYLAQLFGARQRENLKRAMGTMLLLMMGVGLVITLFGELVTTAVLESILKVPEDTFGYAQLYLRIYLLGLTFQFVYNGLAAALRAIGDSKATMIFLVVSSVVNIILDLVFVVLLHMDVAGVAIATCIAQGLSVVISLVYISKKQPLLSVNLRELTFDKEACGVFLKVGIPSSFQSMVSQVGTICVQRLVNSYGSGFMAAVASAGKMEQYAVVPIMSVAQAMIVFSGQNVGAGNTKRAEEGLKHAWRISLFGSVILACIFLIFAKPMIMLFGCRGETLAIGVEYLRFIPVTLMFAAIMFPCRCMLQGAGDVTATMVVTFITLALRVVSAYILTATPIGYPGIWYATGVDFASAAVLTVWRFRSGKWKSKKLIETDENEGQKTVVEI